MIKSYQLSSSLNPNKVFILQKSELEKRLYPQFYRLEFKDNLEKIKRFKHKRLGDIVKFSSETWNQKEALAQASRQIENILLN